MNIVNFDWSSGELMEPSTFMLQKMNKIFKKKMSTTMQKKNRIENKPALRCHDAITLHTQWMIECY